MKELLTHAALVLRPSVLFSSKVNFQMPVLLMLASLASQRYYCGGECSLTADVVMLLHHLFA